jgi:mono/diheme cytochrome c family protein
MSRVRAVAVSLVFAAFAGTAIRAQDQGPTAYARVCAVCHGADAKGKTGPNLLPFEREYLEVRGIVRDGRGEMPAISPSDVSDEELMQIVAYLKKLSEKGER